MRIQEITLDGRPGWSVNSGELAIYVLAGGGHIADLRLTGGDCPNLLWRPPWKGIDPEHFKEDLHAQTYGGGPEARLLSGIRGHNLCFPFWGDPTATEYAAGATFHGESNVITWRREADESQALRISAWLPQSQMMFRRDIRVDGDSVTVESAAENLTCWDKPVAWCEHATFGPPFLSAQDCSFEASLRAGFVTGQEDTDTFDWPQGTDGTQRFDLREYTDSFSHELVNSFRVTSDEGNASFRITNRKFGISVEYVFSATDFAWLNIWEHCSERMQTRAMEVSNTPRHGTMKALVKSPLVMDRPAYEWLDAGSTLRKSFVIRVRKV